MRSVSSPVLVGRDADLTDLERAYEAVAHGRPSIVVVGGEAGIGKSRLVGELCQRVRGSGGRAVIGGCLDLGDGLPYLPFVEALRGLARSVGPVQLSRLLGPARHDFSRVVPELVAPEPVDPSLPPEPPLPSGRLYEGVIGLLERVGLLAPAVLAIEDVQWIDRSSRDLVTFLVRNLTAERVLLVLTARTDALPPGHPTLEWLAELSRQPQVWRMDLAPLGPDAIAQQLEAILGVPPSPGTVTDVVARSDGNPFFAEELLAAARPDAAPARDALTGPTGAVASVVATPTLAGILATRLHAVSPDARTVLGALGVAGRPVDERLLAAVLGVEAATLAGPLLELRDAHIATADPATGAFRFRHVLLAEIALAEVLPANRRLLHRAFAETLTEHPELADSGRLGAAAELAWHWESAGEWEQARTAAIEAGAIAIEIGAHDAAVGQLERAIGLEDRLPEPPGTAERVRILRLAVDAARRAGRLERAVELAGQAAALVDPAVEPVVATELATRRAELAMAVGRPDEALLLVEAAIRDAPEDRPATGAGPLLATGLHAAAEVGIWLRAARDPDGLAGLRARATRLVDRLQALAGTDAGERAMAALGRLELERLDGLDDVAAWGAVIVELDATGERERAARARLAAAEADLRVNGTRAAAAELLRAAHASARELEAAPLLAAIADVARRARVVLEPSVPVGDRAGAVPETGDPSGAAAAASTNGTDPGATALRQRGLSSREIEVLRLVAAGRTNGEIADRLYITRKTAGVHVTHILDKLGVSNRVEAAMVAARLGLSPDEDA